MGQDINIVLEGFYKGSKINFDAENGIVWIGDEKRYDFDNCFYRDVVQSVQKIDAKESDFRDSVHFLFGSAAAAGMSTVQDYIVSVKWKNGKESLIKVREGVYEYILRNMAKDKPDLEASYQNAIKYYESDKYELIVSALNTFKSMKPYKDSREYIEKCEIKLNSPKMIEKKQTHNEKQNKSIALGCLFTLIFLGAVIGMFKLLFMLIEYLF